MNAAATGPLLLLGDVHTRFGVIAAQIEHAREVAGVLPCAVVVAGDLGLFGDDLRRHFRRQGLRFPAPVSFIEGNHEDFRAFASLVADYADVLTHLPRATVQPLGPWRALCLGGARYMDAMTTPRGCEITERDIDACLAFPAGAVDLVVSHDCPCGIGVPGTVGFEHLGPPGMPGFERIAARLRPRLWVFGHHHRWHEHEKLGTRYLGLPESWHGYCLLDPDGTLRRIDHAAQPAAAPRRWKLPGRR
ncbi:hypothetical protein FJ251_14615 [bacterium]|nr:hypothetical protein [bacterium]